MLAPDPPGTILDACCLLNFFATRRIEEILRSLGTRFCVAEAVAAEVLYVRRGGSGEEADEREPVDIPSLAATGLLEVLGPETNDELRTYVSLAAQLDDGEAMTCALALHRGFMVATDERKAIRVLGTIAPGVQILTTTILLKHWTNNTGAEPAAVREVLRNVRERARFFPGRQDPLKAWWDSILPSP